MQGYRFDEVTSSPAVNGGASTAGNPVVRFGFKTGSPGVDGAGFDPRPGASCGAVTGAPIRKRVIAVDFQPTALTQSVEPRGSVSARFTPCRPKAINRASRAPQTWVECGPHPALVRNGMWRNPIETHVADDLAVSVGFRPCHWRRLRHGTDAIHARRERRDFSLIKDRRPTRCQSGTLHKRRDEAVGLGLIMPDQALRDGSVRRVFIPTTVGEVLRRKMRNIELLRAMSGCEMYDKNMRHINNSSLTGLQIRKSLKKKIS